MHQKRWCPQYTSDLRKTAFNCISAWGQHSHRSQTSALKVYSLPKCLKEAHPTSELTTRCCLRAALPPPWDTRVSADLSGSPYEHTERGIAGLNWGNLQSQKQREEGDSNSGAEEEGQTSNVTRHETVSTEKERCGDEEMEREGAVPQDCWTKGVCKAPLSLTGFSNTWELLQLFQTFTFYFSHH